MLFVMSLVLRCQHEVNSACEVISLALDDKNKVNSAREKLKSAQLMKLCTMNPDYSIPKAIYDTINGLDIKLPQQIQVCHVPFTKVNGEKMFCTYKMT